MSDQTPNAETPAQEDPVVHRALGTLPAFRPTSWFEDRVMARVRRPLPRWLRQARATWRHYLKSGKIYGPAAIVAIGSLLPTTAAVILASTFRTQISEGIGWFFGVGVPYVWAQLAAETAAMATDMSAAVGSVLPNPTALAAAGAGSLVLLAGCAWGLHRTMNIRGAARHSRYETH